MNATTTISNQHITEHEILNGLFIREINHPEEGHFFLVLTEDTGEYAGSISDGSDCRFDTLAAAQAWMRDHA